jgi:hypothetical protein
MGCSHKRGDCHPSLQADGVRGQEKLRGTVVAREHSQQIGVCVFDVLHDYYYIGRILDSVCVYSTHHMTMWHKSEEKQRVGEYAQPLQRSQAHCNTIETLVNTASRQADS